jgi:hypothetical protein
MSAITIWLGRLEHDVIDPAVRAIWGASLMRSWAFIQWCPSCRSGDHWNHEARPKPPSRGPVPSPGACWSLGNGVGCSCPWRPA